MKLAYKIVLINLAVAVVITIIALISGSGFNSGADTALVFGLVCLGTGLLNLFAGLILLFTNKKHLSNGMLLSCAVLLLLSGISCSQGFSFK